MSPHSQQRIVDWTSALGVLLLGVGLGIALSTTLAGMAPWLIMAGIAVHGWGMIEKRRLEVDSGLVEPRWAATGYWICWGLLTLLIVVIAGRLTGIL